MKAPLLGAALVAALCAFALFKIDREPRASAGGQKRAREEGGKQRKGAQQANVPANPNYGRPAVVAHLEDQGIGESSGVAVSRLTPGLFWTHNDTKGGPVVHAFDRQGKSRGAWRVAGASVVDWEDIAAGPGPGGRPYLYVGDIGDNDNSRGQIIVYRFPEPAAGQPAGDSPRETEPAESVTLKLPDDPGTRDAETLMVHPRTGDIYIVNKTNTADAAVYKLAAPREFSGAHTLERVGSIRRQAMLGKWFTGGDISPDGRRVALCDNASGYELELPAGNASFDQIWSQPLVPVPLGERKQGEGIAYAPDGSALYATSERLPAPLIEVKRTAGQKKD